MSLALQNGVNFCGLDGRSREWKSMTIMARDSFAACCGKQPTTSNSQVTSSTWTARKASVRRSRANNLQPSLATAVTSELWVSSNLDLLSATRILEHGRIIFISTWLEGWLQGQGTGSTYPITWWSCNHWTSTTSSDRTIGSMRFRRRKVTTEFL